MALLAAGHSNKSIARELGIAVSSVRVHLYAAYLRLGFNDGTRTSRVAAANAYRQQGASS